MKYYYRFKNSINGQTLDMPVVEVYCVKSNGLVYALVSVWGEMKWIKSSMPISVLTKKFKECTLSEVKEMFSNYELY
ncbi:MAG: hypothetical protein HFG90_01375 [Acholeplasmatales bacterium]|nr:hypothetical protein [Acholeplasmatales bacterium]